MGQFPSVDSNRPADIPAAPGRTYRHQGWAGVGDWLGTGVTATRSRDYLPFKQAREFVRGLGLRSQADWFKYARSGKKPDEIPTKPDNTYGNQGWSGYGDWIGNGAVATYSRVYQQFREARAFVRSLGLKSAAEWRAYTQSGRKPHDIPASPNQVYKDKGWSGMGDWLGTGTIATRSLNYRRFKEARTLVHSLGLTSTSEWRAYTKSGKKPDDIPASPGHVYNDEGWAGFGDWLGTATIAPRLRVHRRFDQARTFVRSLGLRSVADWRDYTRSGDKPDDIPAVPAQAYRNQGWVGFGDWLGTGRVSNQQRKFLPFKQARRFVRSLARAQVCCRLDFLCPEAREARQPPHESRQGLQESRLGRLRRLARNRSEASRSARWIASIGRSEAPHQIETNLRLNT